MMYLRKANERGKVNFGWLKSQHSFSFGHYYDAKHKATLPYYDGFPLILMLGPAKGGFMGLNLHYLPPVVRARLLDAVLAEKGSITINGVSLTISKVKVRSIILTIIPHTLKITNLIYLKKNDLVNIEIDMLSRYISKYFK